ncbi:MAG: hypothetical protein ABI697_01695 [Devosia sp.]
MPQQERAQLGLQYVEDAVVALLTEHSKGMQASDVADALGLSTDLDSTHRDMIAEGVLSLLARNGRILWDDRKQIYIDNPARG